MCMKNIEEFTKIVEDKIMETAENRFPQYLDTGVGTMHDTSYEEKQFGFDMGAQWVLSELQKFIREEEDTNYHLFFTNYNNGFEKTYTWMDVDKEAFKLPWKDICNKISTTRFSGLTDFGLQRYLQDNNIFYLHRGPISRKKMDDYLSVKYNKQHSKIITHSNIGNY